MGAVLRGWGELPVENHGKRMIKHDINMERGDVLQVKKHTLPGMG